eukprot:scaffold1140_cov157-Amphora_coffeaeformis.AAC.6
MFRAVAYHIMSGFISIRPPTEPKPEESTPLIVCGDFNGGAECGAVRYLEDGFVDNTFIEDGDPVTSSVKRLPLALPMHDVMEQNDHRPDSSSDPPPTLVEWLTTINGQVGRGDEFREAARQMGWKAPVEAGGDDDNSSQGEKAQIELPPDGVLTLEGFINVYLSELRRGKFWGIAHDFAVLNDPLPITEVYTARYDRMYASAAVKVTAVMDFVSSRPCPNDVEPSDHLPIAAAFELQS